MSLALAIVGTVVGGLAVALAVVLVRFNWKRLRIARIAAATSDDRLDRIYRLIEESAPEESSGCVLGRTNRVGSDKRNLVGLPPALKEFPWSDRSVEIITSPGVTFRFTDERVLETRLGGKVFRAVRMPRVKTSSGKLRNVYSPQRNLAINDALAAALREVCPEAPDSLLSYLLCVGGESFEFEPIDQARIGATPAWVQAEEWPTCDQCNRRLSLILQIPGALLSSGHAAGTFYWFGCKQHAENTKTIEQFT
jgi:hypothetical protein